MSERYKIRAGKSGCLFTAPMDMVYKPLLQANAKYSWVFSVLCFAFMISEVCFFFLNICQYGLEFSHTSNYYG